MTINPTTDSAAPTTPLAAAKNTQSIIVATANPPGSFRVIRCIASNSFSEMPDFSNIHPMKMKRGTADNT